jgi:Ca2+-binding RTX toxin-like protein
MHEHVSSRSGSHALGRPTRRRWWTALAVAVLMSALFPLGPRPGAGAAPVGQGFHLNASDLRFILKQIKISEAHVANTTALTGPCGALLGPGPDQIPANGVGVTLPWGLRTVDGTCNNLVPGQEKFGAADQRFPRLAPKRLRAAEQGTSYAQTSGSVVDSQPRVVSNLIADQTASNPAAVEAAGADPQTSPSGAFLIENTAPDVGLSAPYNSWFTLFGQFFDHGLDLVAKGGTGTVTIPLGSDDPLYRPGGRNVMTLTRATHDGNHEAFNTTSPFIDQSQTYSSHPSHQVFLREYESGPGGVPVGTGRLVTGPGEGMGDWAVVRAQAKNVLGIALGDADVHAAPLIVTDPYGRFVPGPNGLPQIVFGGGTLVEGNLAAPVSVSGSLKTGHAFLNDIAHHANPGTYDPDGPGGPALPVSQVPDSDSGMADDKDPSTYDDEMLAAHFVAGDGRVNENIGLIAVHHVFHSEHNRLVGEIDGMLDTPQFSDAERADWRTTARPAGWDYAERLFQAARFVAEMEYQHLVFEEFIRKVQPMVNPFGAGGTGYRTDVNPAISAEFAHAVYRFGHSMLNESVDRVRADGTRDDIELLDAFLNPPSFMAGYQDAGAAAGAVVRGMTRQVGNELDEFVTEALRNRLLGLPLDLAALNLARARDTGIPTLNAARRQFYADTGNSALEPYTSWADLAFSLRHPASLTNFVAAYGTHPDITGQSTADGKRGAAEALFAAASDEDPAVNGPARDFFNSTGAYSLDAQGRTTSGVDVVDLWIGGLAEKQMVFGGLLGPTFNYVFETQTESLQDADRFYYLSRTAGLNLLTELENNSFAELIQRNTDAASLPADSFSRPALVFDVTALGTSGPILDDPATEWDESKLLVRMADGTIRYAGAEHVVFNGSAGHDRLRSSEGDDTLRGNDGNDRMEGGDGADNLIGGLGDDILTDLFGDDVLKGGDGNDTLSSGQGFGGDLNQGGRGSDFIIGGNDATESFAGPGNDFVFAGDGQDTVFGEGGDDWIEGGKGAFNLLQGDNGAPFQDDPNEPGHDVIDGDGGEQDFDAEGGDDIMLAGPGIQRAEGMLGFDWVSHRSDPQAADSDLRLSALLPPAVAINRDRFDLVEALSGWLFNDTLRGDDRTAATMNGHALDSAGIDRIGGLAQLLGVGVTAFTGGNILIGGPGGDLIEGRGGDDLIDGDAWLNVQLRAPDLSTPDPSDFRLVDGLSALRSEVLAGLINPGDISIVRTIVQAPGGTSVDTAVFSGNLAEYAVSAASGRIVVAHVGGTRRDGTDTIRNIETLQFADQTVSASLFLSNTPATGTVTISDTTPARGQVLTAVATGVTDPDGIGPLTFTWEREAAPGSDLWSAVGSGTTYAPVPADVGARLRVVVSFVDNGGSLERLVSAPTAAVIDVPGPPTIGTATAGNTTATVTWTPPASDGGSPITSYRIQVRNANGVIQAATSPAVIPGTATSAVVIGLTNGTSYTFAVAAVNDAGTGLFSARSNAVTPTGTAVDDSTPPTVVAQSPAPGATGVNRNANVTATFSESVIGWSAANFVLRGPDGTVIPAVVTYRDRNRILTLNPNPMLARQTTYTVTLGGGITDLNNNALAPVTWSFTTG